jgi:hypothetical protein
MTRKNAILTPIKESHDSSSVSPAVEGSLIAAFEQHRRHHKPADFSHSFLTPVRHEDELENRMIDDKAQKVIQQAVLKWRDRNRARQRREKQSEEGFNLAEKIFESNQIPLGTYLGYMPLINDKSEEEAAKTTEKLNESEVILLANGSFLSSEPPISHESTGSMLGVIKPNGVVLFYHAHEEILPRLHPADNYVKLKLTQTFPFEVYRYNTVQEPLYYQYPEKIVRLQNREGENFIRKQSSLDLSAIQQVDEALEEIKRRIERASLNTVNYKKLLLDYDRLNKIQEALEQSYKEQLKAISTTAKIDSDIFEPYCAETIMYTREQADTKNVKMYVERILPDKGETLEKLLNNANTLTSIQRIEIAKQCVALVCSLYDPEHTLSKKGLTYSHGNINLSHFCVSFKKDNAGNDIPKVSLVGFKVYAKDEQKPNPIMNSYMPPEAITGKGESNAYRADIYGLGVVLTGFDNDYKVPIKKHRERIGYLHPLTFRKNVEKSLLSDINVSTLDEFQKRDYTQLMMLARQLKAPRPAHRPDLEELRIVAGFCPALKALQEAIINEHDPHKAAQLDHLAKKAVGIMKALAEYKVHHEEKKEKPSLFAWFGLGTHNKSKKVVKSSKAILNATDVSVFNEELEKLMTEAQTTDPNHRNSFTSILYKVLAKDAGLSSKEMRECKSLVVELAIKTKPSPESKKHQRPSEDELTAEESLDSRSEVSHKASTKNGGSLMRKHRVGISG